MNIHYLNKLKIDVPIVCITTYEQQGIITYGISIRFYAGVDGPGVHKMFSSGSSVSEVNNGPNDIKYVFFYEYAAIVPLVDFNADIAASNINYYLDHYKV